VVRGVAIELVRSKVSGGCFGGMRYEVDDNSKGTRLTRDLLSNFLLEG